MNASGSLQLGAFWVQNLNGGPLEESWEPRAGASKWRVIGKTGRMNKSDGDNGHRASKGVEQEAAGAPVGRPGPSGSGSLELTWEQWGPSGGQGWNTGQLLGTPGCGGGPE